MKYKQGIDITWERFYQDVKKLCQKIKNDNRSFKGIVVITRGGLVPAGIVSSELNIRQIETFTISSYDDDNPVQNQFEILTLPNQAIIDKGENWLVLDELVDSGKTLTQVKSFLPKGIFAVVYTKTINKEIPIDYYEEFFDPNTWLFFPWSVYNFR